MSEYTPYQKKVIERYYDNRDHIMLAKLQEIVTELYLAESEKRIDSLWKRAAKAMDALKVAPEIATHIQKKRDVETLAKNLKQWLGKAKGASRQGKPPRQS